MNIYLESQDDYIREILAKQMLWIANKTSEALEAAPRSRPSPILVFPPSLRSACG